MMYFFFGNKKHDFICYIELSIIGGLLYAFGIFALFSADAGLAANIIFVRFYAANDVD